MMKILVLANFGMGLYKFRKELLQQLIQLGDEVYVSLPYDDYVPLLIDLGCKFIETRVDRRGTNPLNDIVLIHKYRRIVKNTKPDIILSYTIKPNIYGGIVSRMNRTPYLPNVTGLGTSIENKGLLQKFTLFMYRFGLKNATCVFFQNDSNKNYFLDKKVISGNYKVIPGSGINLNEYKFQEYPKNGTVRLLFIGRLMKNKGITELLDAAKHYKDSSADIEFHIIGFNETESNETLQELNANNTIFYHGQLNDVREQIKLCHAIILPSYHEGLSNVLLEAASMGRPILASNIPGCKETFDEKISGFGFEPKSLSGIIDAIDKFIHIPYETKKQMGRNARRKAEKEFNRNIIIDSYLKEINKFKECLK
ncbi:MAG: glycosyltransferase family 4 protein [Firmicutes bacterium]|nr:glycosyltransferase family 4 protein [Bacillota bacterium]